MYDVYSKCADDFINHEEILETLAYADENKDNLALVESLIEKAKLRKGLSHKEASVLLACENEEKITNPGNKTIYRIYDKETGKMRADLICFADETINPEEDLLLFDPIATWKKTKLPGGSYRVRELLVPIFIKGECKYKSPSVRQIAAYCQQEKDG